MKQFAQNTKLSSRRSVNSIRRSFSENEIMTGYITEEIHQNIYKINKIQKK